MERIVLLKSKLKTLNSRDRNIIVGEEKVKLKLRDLYYKVNHIDTSEEYYNFQRNELGIK